MGDSRARKPSIELRRAKGLPQGQRTFVASLSRAAVRATGDELFLAGACRTAKAKRRAGACLFGLDLAVARRRRRDQRTDQLARRLGDSVDGAVEGFLIGLRRPVEAAQL